MAADRMAPERVVFFELLPTMGLSEGGRLFAACTLGRYGVGRPGLNEAVNLPEPEA